MQQRVRLHVIDDPTVAVTKSHARPASLCASTVTGGTGWYVTSLPIAEHAYPGPGPADALFFATGGQSP